MGFIGPRKGLDYALLLHSEIVKRAPTVKMYVIGEPFNKKAAKHYNKLRSVYSTGVSYLGFVKESDLDIYFSKIGYVFLPFTESKYWCSCSGTILNSLRRGKVVWTNPVNAIPEILTDGINGRFFSGDIHKDADEFISMITLCSDYYSLSFAAIETCLKMHKDLLSVFMESCSDNS